MKFDEVLREKINTTSSKTAKSVLKVVLGEYQQKNASGKATEQDGYNVVEKLIAGNKETLGHLKADDPRREALEEENAVLATLLPPYLTADEVYALVKGNDKLLNEVNELFAKGDKTKPLTDAANAGYIGRSTGVVVKFCKAEKLDVKGDTVKEALGRIFTE